MKRLWQWLTGRKSSGHGDAITLTLPEGTKALRITTKGGGGGGSHAPETQQEPVAEIHEGDTITVAGLPGTHCARNIQSGKYGPDGFVEIEIEREEPEE